MNDGKDFGQCETQAPATETRTVSEEQFRRLCDKFDAREKELHAFYDDLYARVRELEADRDTVVERQIHRRLMTTGANTLNECGAAYTSLAREARKAASRAMERRH